jgi:hypothetical protein
MRCARHGALPDLRALLAVAVAVQRLRRGRRFRSTLRNDRRTQEEMMTTLYDELSVAGCRIDSHESDLYVKSDKVSRPIIAAAVKDRRLATKPTLFQSTHPEDRGAFWYEIPFAYTPFWRNRGLE